MTSSGFFATLSCGRRPSGCAGVLLPLGGSGGAGASGRDLGTRASFSKRAAVTEAILRTAQHRTQNDTLSWRGLGEMPRVRAALSPEVFCAALKFICLEAAAVGGRPVGDAQHTSQDPNPTTQHVVSKQEKGFGEDTWRLTVRQHKVRWLEEVWGDQSLGCT